MARRKNFQPSAPGTVLWIIAIILGVLAILASVSDITLAELTALIDVSHPCAIQESIRLSLPDRVHAAIVLLPV